MAPQYFCRTSCYQLLLTSPLHIQPWKVVLGPKLPIIQREKALPRNFFTEIQEGKSLDSKNFFLASPISKSYLPSTCTVPIFLVKNMMGGLNGIIILRFFLFMHFEQIVSIIVQKLAFHVYLNFQTFMGN